MQIWGQHSGFWGWGKGGNDSGLPQTKACLPPRSSRAWIHHRPRSPSPRGPYGPSLSWAQHLPLNTRTFQVTGLETTGHRPWTPLSSDHSPGVGAF